MKQWTDLTSQEKVNRSNIGSIICFFLATAIAVYMYIGTLQANEVKERCIAETQGEVITTHAMTKYSRPYVYVSYIIDGKKYYTRGEYSSDDSIGFFGKSERSVPVYYDPSDPSVSYACDSPRKPNIAVWFFVTIILIIGGFLLIWQGKTIKRKPDTTDTEIIDKINKTGIIHIKAEGEPKNNDEECD